MRANYQQRLRRVPEHEQPPGEPKPAPPPVDKTLWLPIVNRSSNTGDVIRLYADFVCKATRSKETRLTIRSRTKKLLELAVLVETEAGATEQKLIGEVPAVELRRAHVYQVLWALAETPHKANSLCCLIRAAFGWAIDTGLLERGDNPAFRFRRLKTETVPKAFATDQIIGILRAMDRAHREKIVPTFFVDLFLSAFETGLRPFELRALREADVDLGRRTITVMQKGRAHHLLIYPESLHAVLIRRIAESPTNLVFPGEGEGGQLGKNTSSTYWHRILDVALEAGVEVLDLVGRRVTIYGLRHTNVTQKVLRGVPLAVAGASVGQNQEKTTRQYLGPLFEGLPAAAAAIEEVMSEASGATETASEDVGRRIGQNIKAIRRERGLSLEVVGGKMTPPTSKQTLSDVESRCVNLETVVRVAKALGVRPFQILKGVIW